MSISIVIPTINDTAKTMNCVTTFRKFHGNDHEIIIVDDGSVGHIKNTLRILCMQNKCALLDNRINSGFATAVNKGIAHNKSDIIILSNNDITYTENILERITYHFSKDETLGVIGIKLLFHDGRIQHAGVDIFPGDAFGHRFASHPANSAPASKDTYCISVTGAVYAIRRELVNKIGLLNEKYFLANEDTEYSLRAWAAGYKVLYCGEVCATHTEGGTRGNTLFTKQRINGYWLRKEMDGNKLFKEDLKKFNLSNISNLVKQANQGNVL